MSGEAHKGRGTAGGIALVLGGGGARGWAHIGVLRRLLELHVPIASVVGTSAGAFVGAAFAAGRLDVLEEVVRHLDWQRSAQLFFEVGLPRAGLIRGRNVERFVADVVQAERIGDLGLPYAAVATDLNSGSEVVIASGKVTTAVRASISIPGIFTPVRQGGRTLVDGGLVNPVPVSVARELGATQVIAVDVNLAPGHGLPPGGTAPAPSTPPPRQTAQILESLLRRVPRLETQFAQLMRRWTAERGGPGIFDVLTLSTRIAENQVTRARLVTDPPDVLIQPAVGDVTTMEFHHAAPVIAAGMAAVEPHIPTLLRMAGQAGVRRQHTTGAKTS